MTASRLLTSRPGCTKTSMQPTLIPAALRVYRVHLNLKYLLTKTLFRHYFRISVKFAALMEKTLLSITVIPPVVSAIYDTVLKSSLHFVFRTYLLQITLSLISLSLIGLSYTIQSYHNVYHYVRYILYSNMFYNCYYFSY